MATLNFIYRSIKPKAVLTVRLLFRHAGIDYQYSGKTRLEVEKNYWTKEHLINTRDIKIKSKQIEIKIELQQIENHVLNQFKNTRKENITNVWLNNTLSEYYDPQDVTRLDSSVLGAIRRIIENADMRKNARGKLGLSKNRIKSYKQLEKRFEIFQGKRFYDVVDVNPILANEFKKHLIKELNYHNATAIKFVSDLKTVCFDAEKYGIETSRLLKHIEGYEVKSEYILFLNPEELKQIKEATLTSPILDNARKWLLLGCCIGQRVSDLLQIDESNFININGLEVIELRQQKTGKRVVIPVLSDTRDIIKNGLPYPMPHQKLNDNLKVVCRESGIIELTEGLKLNTATMRKEKGSYFKWELISSHVCRRSFASNQYGILPTPLIMSITGHSSEKTLLNYIGKTPLDYAQQIADFYTLLSEKEKIVD